MRRVKKTKRLKFNKLLKARTLKINYVLTKRTFRKMLNKGREVNYGLMKIGRKFLTSYTQFLYPSLYFSHFITNNILANAFPSLVIPKSTNSTPKYKWDSESIIPILSKSMQVVLPGIKANATSGLKLWLFSNSYKSLRSKKLLEFKGFFYQYNYVLTSSMVKATNNNSLVVYYKKLYIVKMYKLKTLLNLFFCV